MNRVGLRLSHQPRSAQYMPAPKQQFFIRWGLQKNADYLNPFSWRNVTSGIAENGTRKSFPANLPAGKRFYRLIKP